jgi:hypothetical protein
VFWSVDSAVSIATAYRLDDQEVGVRVLVGTRIFSFSMLSRPIQWPTQPPIQWVPGVHSQGAKQPGVKLSTNLQLVQRSRKSTPPYAFKAWCLVSSAQGQLYFSLLGSTNYIMCLLFCNSTAVNWNMHI